MDPISPIERKSLSTEKQSAKKCGKLQFQIFRKKMKISLQRPSAEPFGVNFWNKCYMDANGSTVFFQKKRVFWNESLQRQSTWTSFKFKRERKFWIGEAQKKIQPSVRHFASSLVWKSCEQRPKCNLRTLATKNRLPAERYRNISDVMVNLNLMKTSRSLRFILLLTYKRKDTLIAIKKCNFSLIHSAWANI